MLKKGALVENCLFVDVSEQGQTIAQVEDLFFEVDAKRAAVGDRGTIQILSMKNGLARLQEITGPGPQRQAPLCPHFTICGGCSWQHTAYETQVRQKSRMITKSLGELYTAAIEVVASPRDRHYRNKIEYSISDSLWRAEIPQKGEIFDREGVFGIGFYVPRAGVKIVDITECHLQIEPSNSIKNWLRDYAKQAGLKAYNAKSKSGDLRTLLIRSNQKGEVLVMPIFGADTDLIITPFMEALQKAFPSIKSLYYLVNDKRNDSYADLKPIHYAGSLELSESLGDFVFTIGPLSFMQVNPWQTQPLYDLIMQCADMGPDDLVYDLYCGAGTISAWASKKAKKVIGIEIVSEAIEHAKKMAITNKIGNLEFYCGDVKDLIASPQIASQGRPRVVMVDPPRAGLHPSVTQALLKLLPQTIVYVSCKLSSLKPDLQKLLAFYEIKEVRGFDLMPQTHHVETIVKLERRS